MSTNNSNPLAKVAKIAVVIDLIWAILAATFNAVVMNGIGTAAGAGAGTTIAGTILAWIITFIIALLQGAVFIAVIGVFICAGIILFGGKKNN